MWMSAAIDAGGARWRARIVSAAEAISALRGG
jgi:hypothetical protein